jgi:hypothetical protein
MSVTGSLHLLLCVFVFLVQPARAQNLLAYLDQPPADLARAAFATPYGSALIAEFGTILRESADPACLKSNGLTAGRLNERSGEFLVSFGTRMVEAYLATLNAEVYEPEFAARAGPDPQAEMARLRMDPDVRKSLELGRPVLLSDHVKQVVRIIDGDAFKSIVGIRLTRRVSPLRTGNTLVLRLDPTEESIKARERFEASSKSPQLRRYFELAKIRHEAVAHATDRQAMLSVPIRLLSWARSELAKICIQELDR